jgi:hypothetical protein
MHKTINGTAKFYNVAAQNSSRSYKVTRDGKLMREANNIVITKSQTIVVDVSQ